MSDPYNDHILGARDVCSNCFRLIRQEHVSPIRKGDRTRDSGRWTTTFDRIRRRTEVDFADVGDNPTHAKGTWCRCGVESARERIWDEADIDKARFKDLLLNALQTLDEKNVTLRRKETAAYALQAFISGGDGVDAALAEAVDAGIVAAAAADASDDRPVRADGGDTVEP
jgi:hypothetical protein